MLHGKPVPDDVVQFCEQEGILEYLRLADELISEHLPQAAILAVAMHRDPETDEETVVISVAQPGTADDLVKSWERFTSAWVARVPWPQRDKINIS